MPTISKMSQTGIPIHNSFKIIRNLQIKNKIK